MYSPLDSPFNPAITNGELIFFVIIVVLLILALASTEKDGE